MLKRSKIFLKALEDIGYVYIACDGDGVATAFNKKPLTRLYKTRGCTYDTSNQDYPGITLPRPVRRDLPLKFEKIYKLEQGELL